MIFLNFDLTSLPGFVMLINVVKNFAVETPFVLEKNKYQIIKANTRFGNKVDLNFNNEKC